MSLLADLLATVLERRYLPGFGRAADDRDMTDLADELMGTRGEVSGIVLADRMIDAFERLDDAGKSDFFRHMAVEMNIRPTEVRETLAAYEADPSNTTYRAFMAAAEPRRQELIRRLNQVPGATGKLVEMRAELLRLLQGHPELSPVDLDFRHLLTSWFNRGFLVLRPINWESPAQILEKIIEYEAVHAIDSWEDLRRRLRPSDRRCFAFFHPAMPDEPLIFVEVALTRGIASSIQDVLSEARAEIAAHQADTAVFYSISNCQPGLASISFGNSLIKQVAADLAAELPGLKTFATLSPIPGMLRWLNGQGMAENTGDNDSVRQLAAHYLLTARRPDGMPHDPVARFHLGNGASVHAVHAAADNSPKGRAQSAGAMVNYLYDLPRISQNHERFASNAEVIASSEVLALNAAAQKTLSKQG